MGNKKKASKPSAAPNGAAAAASAPAKKSLAATQTALLNLSSLLADDARWAQPSSLPGTLAAVSSSLHKLRALQSSWPSAIPRRDAASFERFTSWLALHGLDMESAPFRLGAVAGAEGDGADNATLFATRAIAEDEVFVTVPGSVMLSTSTAGRSSVSAFLAAVPALRGTPSIALALHLLAEALDAGSAFRPYIDVLPARFSIPFSLPFAPRELLALAPSAACDRAVKTLRSQLVQYVNIYKLLSRPQTGCEAIGVGGFSFGNFEWAVSVVMTRQNQLPPAGPDRPPVLALVPVWDMCNHAVGKPSTSVLMDPGTGAASVECAGMRAFAEGEALTIFYGPRSNVELLLFSGFVQRGNPHDAVTVGIKLDSAEKRENVARMVELRRRGRGVASGVDADGGMVAAGAVVGRDGGVADDRLVLIAKVKAADVADLKDVDEEEGADVDEKARGVLIESIQATLDAYGSKLLDCEELKDAIDESSSTVGRDLVRQLHEEETRILHEAIRKLQGTVL